MSVSMLVLHTEHGLQNTEKERDSDGWTRTKRVRAGHEANNFGELCVR